MSYFVGAYASSPNVSGWDASLETDYYNALKQLPNVRGLEHPFVGTLHPHDPDWFLANVDPTWDFVFTCVPGIMGAMGQNPNFGIASNNVEGRQQALEFMRKACAAIGQLTAHLGRQAVTAIEIQTSPNQGKCEASVASLEASLREMLSWEWHGAQIVIEHCDTYVDGQTPAKGFLTIEQEIEAIQNVNSAVGSNIGLVVNWGRSVIETRSVEGAVNHINTAKEAGMLTGLMFSGVSDQDTEYGAWQDTHMPAEKGQDSQVGAAGSLMTESEIARCLSAANAGELPIVGVKIGIRPHSTAMQERVDYNQAVLNMLAKHSS
ncbi:DUF4862 family protein [Echinimonas agarilytica]|uniref:DUF4862 family protein n=1 Tax=Echinimonas agarilytica TaxID=1215918 RepID=A0AA41W741_9GAMM|nr:DUF4862 family protein [Echinimonas agarilytica]MCM2679891.1 DUF4862 family protein [Echinimonas agarilytica]